MIFAPQVSAAFLVCQKKSPKDSLFAIFFYSDLKVGSFFHDWARVWNISITVYITNVSLKVSEPLALVRYQCKDIKYIIVNI